VMSSIAISPLIPLPLTPSNTTLNKFIKQ
jgi:hypothetical protein